MPQHDSPRSVVPRILLLVAVVALAAFGLWRLTLDEPNAGPTSASPTDSPRAATSAATGAETSVAASRSEPTTRIAITTCRGVNPLDVTIVPTSRGGPGPVPVVARGDVAEAVVPSPQATETLEVVARWRDWTSPPRVVEGRDIAMRVCPGAELAGRVMDGPGRGLPNVALSLVDRAGQVLATTRSDADGAYRFADPDLTGAAVVASGAELAATTRHTFLPLNPLEKRELHLLVSGTRPIVGWVLDVAGDTQPGVIVSLDWEGYEANGRRAGWTAMTDSSGAFAFPNAPPGAVRIRADGGLRGFASARVNVLPGAQGTARRDVTLVLEPSANVRVSMPSAPANAVVVVRSVDPMAHGGVEGMDIDRPGQVSSLVSLASMRQTLVPALSRWDERDVETSLAAVALAMMTVPTDGGLPMRYREYVDAADASTPPAGAELVSLEGVARTAARRAIAQYPETVRYFGRAARRLRGGMDFMSALMQPAGAVPQADELLDAESSPDAYAQEPPLGDREREALGAAFSLALDPGQVTRAGASWAEVAHGGVGDWLLVKAGMRMSISVRVPGLVGEVTCGDVFVGAGEMVEIGCGVSGEAIATGRVVDVDGRPVSGAQVRGEAGPTTTTGADGRFQLAWTVSGATTLDVFCCTDCDGLETKGLVGGRRSVGLAPGRVLDLANIVVVPRAPVGDDGGIEARGGRLVPADEGGFFIEAIDPGGWLENEGVNPGDTLVRIGEDEVGRLGPHELFYKLASEVRADASLQLMLRSTDGQLYPVDAAP